MRLKSVDIINSNFFSTLVCPVSRTNLKYMPDTQELISETASLAFPIKNGVPILLIDEARQIS
jgi:uncharacterized protein YbaR (Trm112 family)